MMEREEIVVGLDCSPSARAALRWAADYARATGGPLRAVHVIDWPLTHAGTSAEPDQEGFVQLPEHGTDSAYRSIMEHELEQVHPEPGWTVQFAEGDAGHQLVRHSAAAGLLVIGTREHVGMERILAGSVSHYCLSHSHCPVAAVPAGAPAAPSEPDEATVHNPA
jgi:nucleotide-binding universal stress UspA family protein